MKLSVGGALLAAGFTGVSDDDFSRTVIAQHFARAPSFSPSAVSVDDPSQTSWLPLPFWITGLAMRLFGGTLGVARAVGLASGVVAMLLVYAAARHVEPRGRFALVAALVACALPGSVVHGAASTPDLLTAAAMTYALALGASRTPAILRAGVAVCAASLCRYEAWLLAPLLVGAAALAARRGEVSIARVGILAALVAVGPLGWIAYNHAAYDDAFHFLRVVSDYKVELQGGPSLGLLLEVPRALLLAEPELLGVFALTAWLARGRGVLGAHRAAFVIGAGLALALTAISLRGGGPTHHVERASYSLHLYLVLPTTALVQALAASGRTSAHVLAIAAPLSLLRLVHREALADRATEIEMGEALDRLIPRGERVVIVATDFGHFAIQASFGRPGDAAPHAPVGPTLGGVPSTRAVLDAARARDARWVVGPFDDPPPFDGQVAFCHRGLCVAELHASP